MTLMFGKTIPLTNAEMPSSWGLALNTHTHSHMHIQKLALSDPLKHKQAWRLPHMHACMHACCCAVHTLPTLWIETKCMKGKRMFIVPARLFFSCLSCQLSNDLSLYFLWVHIFKCIYFYQKENSLWIRKHVQKWM